MKTLFYIVSALILLSSCDSSNKKVYVEENITIKSFNENKNTESIYGVLNLKLGITKLKDIEIDYFHYGRNINVTDVDFYEKCIEKEPNIKVGDYEDILIKELKVKGIKRLYFYIFRYEDVEISNLVLYFLNDTLVEIDIFNKDFLLLHSSDTYDISDFLEGFIDKYGKGIGNVSENSHTANITENRIWKNSKIKVEYNEEHGKILGAPEYFDNINRDFNGILTYKIIDKSDMIDSLVEVSIKNSIDIYYNNIKKDKEKLLGIIKSNM